jgi:hypothetical protein
VAAWIPVESKLHMAFVLLIMEQQAGFNVESFPWMSNCGNLLAAASILLHLKGINISIKYCLEHIYIRNVVHKFKIGKDKLGRLRTILSAMQASFKLGVYV